MKKCFVFGCAVFFVFSQIAVASFSDVSDNHIYFKAIDYLQKNGVVEGYKDSTFKPDKEVNRAEFLKMLYGATGKGNPGVVKPVLAFSDVDGTEWYGNYVEDAYLSDIIDGYPDGTFKPGNPINMVEAVKIVMNGFVDDVDAYYSFTPYEWCLTDLSFFEKTNPWYYKYLHVADTFCTLPSTALVNKKFDPGKLVTRGEMAELLYKVKAVKDHTMKRFETSMEPDPLPPGGKLSSLCSMGPTKNDSGENVYPINPKYGKLNYLGQLFTADDCGKDRLKEIPGVDGENYTIGSLITLTDQPDKNIFGILKNIGFWCFDSNYFSDEACKSWMLDKAIKLTEILKLKEFENSLATDTKGLIPPI